MPDDTNASKDKLAKALEKKLGEAVRKADELRQKQDQRIEAIDDPDLRRIVQDKRLSFAR